VSLQYWRMRTSACQDLEQNRLFVGGDPLPRAASGSYWRAPVRRCMARMRLIASVVLLLCALSAAWAQGSSHKPQAILTVDRRPTIEEIARRNTHAKYEPPFGCYLGAYIDFDSSLKRPLRDQNGTAHQDPGGFEQIVGRAHSMYFFYLGYGRRLPLDWVRQLARWNKFVHIALEPNDGLKYVKDNAYLRQLADDMGRSGAKIFLRFASEMNGTWTNYYRNPAEYRRKFRLVHDVMRKRAPNVAMVWCPYMEPTRNIPDYYPGDDATDWVGINLYSVTYHNNHLYEAGEQEHPCDFLSFIYRRYAERKPIMICEYAATHYGACENRPRPDFAIRKILTLYSALPRLFPRIKCINYFDGNTLDFAADHAYNDYSVTDDSYVTAAYRSAVSSPYFLDAPLPDTAPHPPSMPMPVAKGDLLRGRVRLGCWARGPSDHVSVRYKVDGYLIYKANTPDQWECFWNAGSVRPGKHVVTLEVYNARGKKVASQTIQVATAG